MKHLWVILATLLLLAFNAASPSVLLSDPPVANPTPVIGAPGVPDTPTPPANTPAKPGRVFLPILNRHFVDAYTVTSDTDSSGDATFSVAGVSVPVRVSVSTESGMPLSGITVVLRLRGDRFIAMALDASGRYAPGFVEMAQTEEAGASPVYLLLETLAYRTNRWVPGTTLYRINEGPPVVEDFGAAFVEGCYSTAELGYLFGQSWGVVTIGAQSYWADLPSQVFAKAVQEGVVTSVTALARVRVSLLASSPARPLIRFLGSCSQIDSTSLLARLLEAPASPPGALPPVASLTATDGTYTDRVRLSWSVATGLAPGSAKSDKDARQTSATSAVTRFRILRTADNDVNGVRRVIQCCVSAETWRFGVSAQTLDDDKVRDDRTYTYWIQGVDTFGREGPESISDEGYAASPAPPPPPPAPAPAPTCNVDYGHMHVTGSADGFVQVDDLWWGGVYLSRNAPFSNQIIEPGYYRVRVWHRYTGELLLDKNWGMEACGFWKISHQYWGAPLP